MTDSDKMSIDSCEAQYEFTSDKEPANINGKANDIHGNSTIFATDQLQTTKQRQLGG